MHCVFFTCKAGILFKMLLAFIACILMNFLFVYSVLGSHTIGSPSRFVTHYGMGHTIKHRYGNLGLSVVFIRDFANVLIHACNCT